MIGAYWWPGGLPASEPLPLRRWAHMLGCRGHFTTGSRHYSTTLPALRSARTDHRAQQGTALGLPDRLIPRRGCAVSRSGVWRLTGPGQAPLRLPTAHV